MTDIPSIPVVAPVDPEDDDEAEVAAIAAVAAALKPLTPSTRRRVISWAAGKYGTGDLAGLPVAPGSGGAAGTSRRDAADGGRAASGSKTVSKRKAAALSLDKGLNLRPAGVQSFADFAAAKDPKTFDERNAVAVYWLTRVASHDGATVNQVFTCYKDRGWRPAANPRNKLAVTASTKGWIDTSKGEAITITHRGETFVEHDLPTPTKDES